jgi:prepilin-type N-terminal cleavage/methylation domain-containing protein
MTHQKSNVPDKRILWLASAIDRDARAKVEVSGSSGHSLIEMLIVVALIGVLSSLVLPQLVAERRLSRSVGVTREILTQLRYARQLAMSRRQSVTFQYDDPTKQIRIINHNNNQIPSSQLHAFLAERRYSGRPATLSPPAALLSQPFRLFKVDCLRQK